MACYSIGLDLGQVRDYSALILVERVQVFDKTHTQPRRYPAFPDEPRDEQEVYDEYHVRHIQRWSLGTDYMAVADSVAKLMSEPALEYALLTVDRTGVGGGICDILTQHYMDGRLGALRFRPLTLTAGVSTETVRGDGWSSGRTAPKGDVIARLMALAGWGHIKTAPGIPGGDALKKELRAFQLKQNARTGNVRFEAQRESDHDDLVIALALAVWFRNDNDWPRYKSTPDGPLYDRPEATADVFCAGATAGAGAGVGGGFFRD